MDITFAILHSNATKCRRDYIKSTWGAGARLIFCADYSADDVVAFTTRNDHASAEIKHIGMIQYYLQSRSQSDWVFFCDDDTFVNSTKLIRDLPKFDKSAVHGQGINCWGADISLHYPSGGAGYLVHRETIFKVAKCLDPLPTGFSDVTFGIAMRAAGIRMQHSELFKSQPPAFYNIPEEHVPSYYSFHYIKTEEQMTHLWELSGA